MNKYSVKNVFVNKIGKKKIPNTFSIFQFQIFIEYPFQIRNWIEILYRNSFYLYLWLDQDVCQFSIVLFSFLFPAFDKFNDGVTGCSQ